MSRAADEAHARETLRRVLDEFVALPTEKHGKITLHFHGGRIRKWSCEVFNDTSDVGLGVDHPALNAQIRLQHVGHSDTDPDTPIP